MAPYAIVRVTQFLPEGAQGYVRDHVADTSCDSLVYDTPGNNEGGYNLTHLYAVQNPCPSSSRSSVYYRTTDLQSWSDSTDNQPDLDDRYRYAFGRYDSRWRNLDDYVGVVIHDRDFSSGGENNIYDTTFEGVGGIRNQSDDYSGTLLMQDHERVSGDVIVRDYNFIVSASPVPFSYKNTLDSNVCIKLSNYVSPLASGTVTLSLNDENKTPLEVIPFYTGLGGFTACWYNDQKFDYDTQINVEWRVFDEESPPNEIVFIYWFRTVGDYVGPRASNESPQDDAIDVVVDTCIEFDVRDFETGVNISTLELYVNNVLIPNDILTITLLFTSDGYHVLYCPDENFLYGDDIAISIYVEDLATESNYLFHVYSFRTEYSISPKVVGWEPSPCIEYVPVDADVSVDVVDGSHGLNKDTIDMGVDDKTLQPRKLPIIYREE